MVRRALLKIGKTLLSIGTVASGLSSDLAAQVGLPSDIAQVTLVARSAPRASLPAVGPVGVRVSHGAIREAAVKVSFSTNTSYHLVVRGVAAGSKGRLWVRAARGDYREVLAGSSVTVARGAHSSGSAEREVSYRFESDATHQPLSLPVRYEIVVVPAI